MGLEDEERPWEMDDVGYDHCGCGGGGSVGLVYGGSDMISWWSRLVVSKTPSPR